MPEATDYGKFDDFDHAEDYLIANDEDFEGLVSLHLEECGFNLGNQSPINLLLRRINKPTHTGLFRASASYELLEYKEKAIQFANGAIDFYSFDRKVAALAEDDQDPHAVKTRSVATRLETSGGFSVENLIEYVASVEKSLKKRDKDDVEVKAIKEYLKATPSETKLLPKELIVFVDRLTQAIGNNVLNRPSFTCLSDSEKNQVLLLTQLSECLPNSNQLDQLFALQNNPINPACWIAAEEVMAAAVDLELAMTVDFANYAYLLSDQAVQPLFATRLALASVLARYDQSQAVLDLISILYAHNLRLKESASDALDRSRHENRPETPTDFVIQEIFAKIDAEYPRFEFRSEYSRASDWRNRLGMNTTPATVTVDPRQRGYVRFLNAVFDTLLASGLAHKTICFSLASKLIVWNCKVTGTSDLRPTVHKDDSEARPFGFSIFNPIFNPIFKLSEVKKPKAKRGKEYFIREPVCFTPTPANGQKTYAASSTVENVFEKYIQELVKIGRGYTSAPLLDMVRSIYFADRNKTQVQPGFDWRNARNKIDLQEIASDEHVPSIEAGDNWGDFYLWLFGKHFAAAVESAIETTTNLLADEVKNSKLQLKLNETRSTKEPEKLLSRDSAYVQRQTFAAQAARFARFIFMIPETHSPANAYGGSKNYNLRDKPLVQDELKGMANALARRIAQRNPHLRLLYEPIYNSGVKVSLDNPFFGDGSACL
jgi:hypothetical protein